LPNGAGGVDLTKFPHRRVLLVVGNHIGNNRFCTPAIGFLKRHLREVRFDLVTPNRRGASVFSSVSSGTIEDIDCEELCAAVVRALAFQATRLEAGNGD
jgi:hypothetical protein